MPPSESPAVRRAIPDLESTVHRLLLQCDALVTDPVRDEEFRPPVDQEGGTLA
jgi:hypothetical protein